MPSLLQIQNSTGECGSIDSPLKIVRGYKIFFRNFMTDGSSTRLLGIAIGFAGWDTCHYACPAYQDAVPRQFNSGGRFLGIKEDKALPDQSEDIDWASLKNHAVDTLAKFIEDLEKPKEETKPDESAPDTSSIQSAETSQTSGATSDQQPDPAEIRRERVDAEDAHSTSPGHD